MNINMRREEVQSILDELKAKFKEVQSYHFDSLEILLFNLLNRDRKQNKFLDRKENGITSARFPSVNARIKHSFFYLLWSLKWFQLRLSEKNNFIICSFIGNRKLSYEYLAKLMFFVSKENSKVIHFGIIYSFKYLFDSKIICIPFFFLKLFQNKKKKVELSNQIFKQLNISFKRRCNYKLNEEINYIIYNHNHIEECLDTLIKRLHTKGNIKAFIQDIDFYLERVILAGTCKKNLVKTISVDHSLIFENTVPHYYTDYFFVWGNYNKDKLFHENQVDGNRIYITGKPQTDEYIDVPSQNRKLWIYFLPAICKQLIWNPERNIEHSLKSIQIIQEYINENNPEVKLCIRKHPSDSECLKLPGEFNEWDNNYTGFKLAFIEDSSVIIELLKSDISVVYVKDSKQKDNLLFGKYLPGLAAANDKENLYKTIRTALVGKQVKVKKNDFMNFLISNENTFGELFSKSLNKVINS